MKKESKITQIAQIFFYPLSRQLMLIGDARTPIFYRQGITAVL
jgi:hypothetical protein